MAILRALFGVMRRDLGGELFALPLYRALVVRPPVCGLPRGDFSPLLPGDAQTGRALFAGHFVLAGTRADYATGTQAWTIAAPSRRFARRLHGFEWLKDLLAVPGGKAKAVAGAHIDDWITHYGRWNAFSWDEKVCARRCLSWLGAATTLLAEEGGAGPARRRSLLLQILYLRRCARRATAAKGDMHIAFALIAAGVLLPGLEDCLEDGFSLLQAQLKTQILPDGGHVSRNPQKCVLTLQDLVALSAFLDSTGTARPEDVDRAIRRLAPMARFFQYADGGLAVFNGGGEGQKKILKAFLNKLKIADAPFSYAPHSGYQRIARKHAVVILDTGRPPPVAFSHEAHAGALAFELSTPQGRLVTNCGWSPDQPEHWRAPVRLTAGHSTLVLGGESSADIYFKGLRHSILGPQLIVPDTGTPARRTEEPHAGTWVEAQHAGYLQRFGVIHQRRLFVSTKGDDVRGEDTVFHPANAPYTNAPKSIRMALRFHLHPLVKTSMARDGKQVLLRLPGQGGWKFRCGAGPLSLEPSVYLAAGAPPMRTKQIVLYQHCDALAPPGEEHNIWRWSFTRLKN